MFNGTLMALVTEIADLQEYKPKKLPPERYTSLEQNFNKYPMCEDDASTDENLLYFTFIPIKRRSYMRIIIKGRTDFTEYCDIFSSRSDNQRKHVTMHSRNGSVVLY